MNWINKIDVRNINIFSIETIQSNKNQVQYLVISIYKINILKIYTLYE